MKIPEPFISDLRELLPEKDTVLAALGLAGEAHRAGQNEEAKRLLEDMLSRNAQAPVGYALEVQRSVAGRQTFLDALEKVKDGEALAEFASSIGEFVGLHYLLAKVIGERSDFENYPTAVASTEYLRGTDSGLIPCLRTTITSHQEKVFTFSADVNQILGLIEFLSEHVTITLERWKGLEVKFVPGLPADVRRRGEEILRSLRRICAATGVQFQEILSTSSQELQSDEEKGTNR